MSATVAAILGTFFVIGVAVGTVIVVAMSALRADRQGRLEDPQAEGLGGPGEPPPDPGWEDPVETADDQPAWPGGSSNAFGNG